MAYGYRNFHNFRRRILATLNAKGTHAALSRLSPLIL
ncbi:MAG: hypothetical protein RR998_08025 [Oscillospiraceae bacterium]